MKEVLEILEQNNVVTLATVDESNKPQARAFEVAGIIDNKVYFFTGKGKDVFKQLNSNPSVAFATTTPDYVSVRVRGLVEFTEDMSLKESLLNNKPGIKQIYKSADNPILALFSIKNMEAEIFDMSVMPPRIKSF